MNGGKPFRSGRQMSDVTNRQVSQAVINSRNMKLSHWQEIGKSDEWYTPKYIFDALECEFDLDVAAPNMATHVPAKAFITCDSLVMPWPANAFVWMNSPFGGRNGLEPWLSKFFKHGNGIALTPDRTSAPWFQKAASMASLILFLSPKVKFERPNGSIGKSPSGGTALLAVGERGEQALRRGAENGLGFLSKPMKVAV